MSEAEKKSVMAFPIILLVAGAVAFAGSQGSVVAFGVPLFALCVAIAFIIQWIMFVPAFMQQTEGFFDLTGSITYVLVLLIAVVLGPSADARALLLFGIIAIWAIRLGSFLFSRIRADGIDGRFTEIKPSFPRFFTVWTIQGLWVTFSSASALAAITSSAKIELGIFATVGFLVWVIGFAIEVIADQQKKQFRNDPKNKGKFINSGLWSWSRHPNYFGEIMLWVGVSIIAFPALSGWQLFTLISPIFITFLLTRVSGLPMLEARADAKWGGQADYEAYKASTSVLIPMPPSR